MMRWVFPTMILAVLLTACGNSNGYKDEYFSISAMGTTSYLVEAKPGAVLEGYFAAENNCITLTIKDAKGYVLFNGTEKGLKLGFIADSPYAGPFEMFFHNSCWETKWVFLKYKIKG